MCTQLQVDEIPQPASPPRDDNAREARDI